MLFKARKKLGSPDTGKVVKRSPGGQLGHKGVNRRLPKSIDKIVETISLQKQPFLNTLHKTLLQGAGER